MNWQEDIPMVVGRAAGVLEICIDGTAVKRFDAASFGCDVAGNSETENRRGAVVIQGLEKNKESRAQT